MLLYLIQRNYETYSFDQFMLTFFSFNLIHPLRSLAAFKNSPQCFLVKFIYRCCILSVLLSYVDLSSHFSLYLRRLR